jgi:hypothetical protein
MAKLKTQIGNCTVDNCTELKYAHNLCKKHNSRRYRTGRTDLGPRVEDKVEYALEILKQYAPEYLREGV